MKENLIDQFNKWDSLGKEIESCNVYISMHRVSTIQQLQYGGKK